MALARCVYVPSPPIGEHRALEASLITLIAPCSSPFTFHPSPLSSFASPLRTAKSKTRSRAHSTVCATENFDSSFFFDFAMHAIATWCPALTYASGPTSARIEQAPNEVVSPITTLQNQIKINQFKSNQNQSNAKKKTLSTQLASEMRLPLFDVAVCAIVLPPSMRRMARMVLRASWYGCSV
eukprot:3667048-Rhodomonas_salina.2